ncbi:hypothetical protein GC174_18200 [bacterium]|nr:hypothetical protein [bacterium]
MADFAAESSSNLSSSLGELELSSRCQALESEVRSLELELRKYYSGVNCARNYPMVGPIVSEAALAFISSTHAWHRFDGDILQDIVIQLNSEGEFDDFGNSFTDTFAIIDAIRRLQSKGHRVIVQVTGTASRQAVAILQIADYRVITPNSAIMLTESTFPGFHRDSSSSRDEIRYRKELEAHANRFIIQRSQITAEDLKANTEYQKEWWFNAQESLDYGLVDMVGVYPSGALVVPPYPVQIEASDTLQIRKQKLSIQKNFLRYHLDQGEIKEMEVMLENPRNLYFFGEVNHISAGTTIIKLQEYSRLSHSVVDIYLNTPGGSVHDGLALMDVMEELKAAGHIVNLIVLGQAASMGGFILQAASRRVMGANARILIHRISRIFGGGGSQIEDQDAQMKRLEEQAMPLLAARTNLSVEEILERTNKQDWWITAKEALELGLIDEII